MSWLLGESALPPNPPHRKEQNAAKLRSQSQAVSQMIKGLQSEDLAGQFFVAAAHRPKAGQNDGAAGRPQHQVGDRKANARRSGSLVGAHPEISMTRNQPRL